MTTSTHPQTVLEHAIGVSGTLTIRLRNGSARLRGVDGDLVRVRDVSGRAFDDRWAIDRTMGALVITTRFDHDAWPGWRKRGDGLDLEVEVPTRATVDIESASGDLSAEWLVGDQRYHTVSGEISVHGQGRITVETVSGDVDVTTSGEAAVAARTVSGDLAIRAGTLSGLRATSMSGDVRVAGRLAGPGPFSIDTVSGDTLVAPAAAVRLELTTLAGDFRPEIDGRPEGGRGRRAFVVGSGGPTMTVRSLSGDVRVVPPAPMADTGRGEAPSSGTAPQAASPTGTDAPAITTATATVDPGTETPTERIDFDRQAERSGDARDLGTETIAAEVTPAASSTEDARAEPPTEEAQASAGVEAAAGAEDPGLEILRALERGEISVEDARRRLEAVDHPDRG